MTFRAVDHRGRTVGTSRDLAELQAVSPAAPASRSPARSRAARGRHPVREWARRASVRRHRRAATARMPRPRQPAAHRRAHRHHDVGPRHLPEVVDTRVAGGVVRGYPALVDEKDAVALRIESTPSAPRASPTRASGACCCSPCPRRARTCSST
jgi:ATP-dependent helicase HrpA